MKTQSSFAKSVDSGKLYLVPTPIGNLDDMTFRAIKTLKAVDLIAAEDTRHTQQLLNHFEIENKKISFHEHNTQERIPLLVDKLKNGENIAQVSDAGMPSISDPGKELVRACIDADIPVIPLPGANAGLTALIASGLAPQPFYFYGFLKRKKNEQIDELKNLNHLKSTFIIYESPYRLKKTLSNMCEVLGNSRQAVVCRELTKKFEEFNRGKLSELLNWATENTPRGEFLIIVDGNSEDVNDNENDTFLTKMSINEQVDYFISKDMKTNDAIKKVAKMHGVKKQEIYNLYHQI
ncbi:16S rRNA (cytidine(1402)-2'-O)-methyltransferase [Apilactobacillus sp. TMW 2.2458]|uniref:Ribosomal RNA small subunit methyltransferase I n=1 Tax=Apilactobacillus xinyiensis TaxID=2841032 RepID=A0ABT0I2S5_9LACO|nr:16S rRNA (cytidine(1402)-2'-O)-methyltransferase [Apilactobacillus xinyiensis]MCK8625038.1 16S rRNA (cytidine(1402)-2'-O)-methyltransferase [Apilactobacillus xinyiensis]MCL0319066.1 16S rRNA (cytidine(1402)-2'-O)-methyltransferase [Apilactobacillus xinyiensis]